MKEQKQEPPKRLADFWEWVKLETQKINEQQQKPKKILRIEP